MQSPLPQLWALHHTWSQVETLLYSHQMGLFNYLLHNIIHSRIFNFTLNQFHANLARGKRLLHWRYSIYSSIGLSHSSYEDFLHYPIRKTYRPLLPPCFHQTRGQFLLICFTPWSLNFLNLLFLSYEHVAYWYFRSLHSWRKRLCIDSRPCL